MENRVVYVMATNDLHTGQFGTDNGHDFEIVETSGVEVKIRYASDGREAWFQDNRFEISDSGLTLN
jgi:hypothetical protein